MTRQIVLLLSLTGLQLSVARAQQAGAGSGPAIVVQPRDSSRPALRQFQPEDLAAWRSIRSATLSPDGKWFAYQLAPNEGDAEVIVRSTGSDNKELRFPIGDPGTAGGVGPPGGFPAPVPASLLISADSKWVAFTAYPTAAEAKRLRQTRRPGYNRVVLVNLLTGEKREFEKIRRFAFNGDRASWLALHAYPAEAPAAAPASPGASAPPARGPEGTDLLLLELSSGAELNVGNVGEFAFDDAGDFLAYSIDARDQAGNGIQLRNLKSDVVRPLDSERALYRRLAWSDTLQALSVLRGRIDSLARDTVFSVVGFTGIAAGLPKRVVVDAREHPDFPAGMKVSGDRSPRWSEDLSALFFGIREARQPVAKGEGGEPRAVSPIQPGAPGAGGTINQPSMGQGGDDELPSLVLWHWKDPRLQPQQIVEESRDKSFSFLTEYRLAENKVLRLADETVRGISLAPHDRFAYGSDTREYDQPASYNGRRFADVYTIDLRTGARKLALKKMMFTLWPAPDGTQAMYYGEDAQFHLLDFADGTTRELSKGAPVSFADLEDDHNNLVPPPNFPLGWSKDASAVLLSDGWDVWRVPARSGGAAAVNLTGDGKRTAVRYQRRYVFDPKEKGIDLTKPLYFATYGEWTKQEGLAVVEPGKPAARSLLFDAARYAFLKAKHAESYLYTRQTFTDFPDYY
ncbi:MAG TPA: hypothetical protein VGP61_09560, partial [Gemmatimonadales bacterium]|nr:hypothetical protein [Gemmatimonadales bacterium]